MDQQTLPGKGWAASPYRNSGMVARGCIVTMETVSGDVGAAPLSAPRQINEITRFGMVNRDVPQNHSRPPAFAHGHSVG